MKTYREIAEMHYNSEPTSTIDRIYKNNRIDALEKLLTEQLRLHVVVESNFICAKENVGENKCEDQCGFCEGNN